MAKRLWFFLLITVLGLGSTQCVLAADDIQDDVAALKAKVTQAAKLLSKDSAQALKEFNDPQGEWAAEPYIFAFKFDGTTLALPAQPEAVGTNRMDKKDVKGRSIVVMALEVVKAGKGQGWLEVRFKQPNRPQEPSVQKLIWLMRVPGQDAFVGAGLYGVTKGQMSKPGKGR